MNRLRILSAGIIFLFAAASCIPDIPGKGLSAHYAAVLNGSLLIAGGCNFPDGPAYEGGATAYYKDIFILASGGWKEAGRLPKESAYGASASDGNTLYIAGGASTDGESDTFLSISIKDGKAALTCLPSMPKPVQQSAAVLTGSAFYVLGGYNSDGPNLEVLEYDFSESSWSSYAELPLPLVQPVAAWHDGALYIWGGYDPSTRKAVCRGFCLKDGVWSELPGVPDGGTLVGSAYAMSDDRLYITGGVNNEVFDYALTLDVEQTKIYQQHPTEYYRFRSDIYCFDFKSQNWIPAGNEPESARAGAVLVIKDGRLVNTGGEIRPCVRDPRVFIFDIEP